MIDTDNHAIVFCGKDIVLVGLDVYAVVYLRFAFVYRIFTLTVRRSNEHELPALYRHTVT